jgi:hypothetical protein
MELTEFNAPSFDTTTRKIAGFLPPPKEDRVIHMGKHIIYLMDLRDGSVQRRAFGPDWRLGAVED